VNTAPAKGPSRVGNAKRMGVSDPTIPA
jgi:hypothetical protein